jgi:hypothetical protein
MTAGVRSGIGLSESSGLNKNGASKGTPESHARKVGKTDRFSSLPDACQPELGTTAD